QIHADYPFSDEIKALFDSAFLITYGLMYLGGGLLMDKLGTRRGMLLVMIFWSIASASQGLAGNYGMAPVFGMSFALVMLIGSRGLLGIGEGGGFPAATRVVAEWFPVNERASAMGLINAGTAVGAVVAPGLIWVVLKYTGWFGLASWRWVFFVTGALGLLWSIWWSRSYFTPETQSQSPAAPVEQKISLRQLLQHRETWAIIGAKFLSDGAWYFYIFWLPKFLMETFSIKFSVATTVGWIPYAAAGVGSLIGGAFSSWLLARGFSVN